ncbi:MAG: hypothetical protein RR738_01720 [Anaerorhabdus sp.]|uniref:hypothetical protein n=1 Tax=Anaerorhabdus sp. TaxID=1872524 RepID=UPI002FCBDB67
MTVRVKSTIYTFISSIVYQAIILLSGFLVRRAFLNSIGVDFLGVDGFFSTIISMLNLLDLGVGASSVFFMSKAFAKRDRQEVVSVYRVYQTFYKYIALIMLFLGIIISFNISRFVNVGSYEVKFLQVVFLLQFARTISSYLLICPRTALQCNQKNYICITLDSISAIVFMIVKLIVITKTGNYMYYLVIMLSEIIVVNLFIRFIFRKEFPEVKKRIKLNEKNKKEVSKYASSIVFSNINDFVYRSTDNMVLTTFLGFRTVGFMSNYYYIFNAIEALFAQIFLSVAASVTNYIHDDDVNENENVTKLFYTVFFVGFLLTLFCSICLFGLTNGFITIAFGSQYVLDDNIKMVMTATFSIVSMQVPLYMYISGKGLINKEVLFSIACTVVNLTISIVLVQKIGTLGVLLGTLSSSILFFTMRARLVITNIIHEPWRFVKTAVIYFGAITIGLFTIQNIFVFHINSWTLLVLKGLCCLVVFVLISLIFIRCTEFSQVIMMISSSLGRKEVKK